MTDAPPIVAPVVKRSRVAGILSGLGASLLLLVLVSVYLLGLLYNALFIVVLIAVPCAILLKGWSAFRRKLLWRFAAKPLCPEMRRYLFQCCNRWLFLGTQLVRVLGPVPGGQCAVLNAPFRGEWYVFQGGRSALLNHHYLIPAQRHALDLCKLNDDRTSHGDATKLESYAAYGQELFAPADGKIVKVVNDRADEAIGGSDEENPVGNHVVIEIGAEKFVLLAHLMQDSVVVRVGDPVRRGDKVARCGNSGNTSEPHLHLQVQNRADFDAPDLRTYPMLFSKVRRTRLGRTELLALADLRRNDRVVPAEKSK